MKMIVDNSANVKILCLMDLANMLFQTISFENYKTLL